MTTVMDEMVDNISRWCRAEKKTDIPQGADFPLEYYRMYFNDHMDELSDLEEINPDAYRELYKKMDELRYSINEISRVRLMKVFDLALRNTGCKHFKTDTIGEMTDRELEMYTALVDQITSYMDSMTVRR